MAVKHRQEFRFTGWHMSVIMIIFFGVIIAVNLTMAVLAGTSWTGLVVKNSYVESQKFNGYLAATRAQEKLGWQSSFSISDGQAVWLLADASGKPVLADSVQATFLRPVNEENDFEVLLTRRADGGYGAPVIPASGRWIVRLSADAGLAKPFVQVKHIVVEP